MVAFIALLTYSCTFPEYSKESEGKRKGIITVNASADIM